MKKIIIYMLSFLFVVTVYFIDGSKEDFDAKGVHDSRGQGKGGEEVVFTVYKSWMSDIVAMIPSNQVKYIRVWEK